jgi:hypothetical protein
MRAGVPNLNPLDAASPALGCLRHISVTPLLDSKASMQGAPQAVSR